LLGLELVTIKMTNKLDKKYVGLAISLSALFVSCKSTNDNVGIKIQEAEGVFTHQVLDLTQKLHLSTTLQDSAFFSEYNSFVYLGAYTDPYAGKVQSNAFLQLGLSNENPDFSNAVCQSVEFHLAFDAVLATNRSFLGDQNLNAGLEVYKLTQFFTEDTVYPTKDGFTFDPNLLGTANFSANDPNNNIKFNLDKSIGQELLLKASGKSATDFYTSFSGLALLSNTKTGTISSFDLNSDSSYVNVSYSQNGENKTYTFDLNSKYRHHTQISADRSTNLFSNLANKVLLPSSQTNQKVMLQNGVGASIFIKIDDFKADLDTTSPLLINKALITLPLADGTFDYTTLKPISFYNIYEADNAGNILLDANGKRIQLISENDKIINSINTYFLQALDQNYYQINISYYFQEYILGKRKLNNLLLVPNAQSSSQNFMAQANRSIIDVNGVSFELYLSNIK
jgi:hypothetical protein